MDKEEGGADLFDEMRAFIRFANKSEQDKKSESLLNKRWNSLIKRIIPIFSIEADIEAAVADSFASSICSSGDSIRKYIMRGVRMGIKKLLLSGLDEDSEDAFLSEAIVETVERAASRCVSKLKSYNSQDALLIPLVEAYNKGAGDKDKAFDEIAKMFSQALKNNIRWANPGNRAEGLDFEAELILERDVLRMAVQSYCHEADNQSPSQHIANELFKESSKRRRSELDCKRIEHSADFEEALNLKSQVEFSMPALGELIGKSFGITQEEFCGLIFDIALEQEERKKNKSPSEKTHESDALKNLKALVKYKCGIEFPLEMRIYAIYLRDCKEMKCEEICNILKGSPFFLQGLDNRKLSDVLDKTHRKIRKAILDGSRARKGRKGKAGEK
ncbi:MAG: hypothetical protein LBU32_03920 [Clostridiales bacterium]|nr:hypothetical protein [Clostridiales bacterium]